MLVDKIENNVNFASELSVFLDTNFESYFSQAVNLPEIEFDNEENDEDLLDLGEENGELIITMNDRKIKIKIANMLLENAVQDKLLMIQYETSKNTRVGGYQ